MNSERLNRIFIGLGANLDEPEKQINRALESISKVPGCTLVKSSSFYRSAPMGPQDQDDYINAVAEIKSELPALELLDKLQEIEQLQGRVRKEERWGPRTLDLDILLIGNKIINTARLTVPHYGIKLRNFVLVPLLEIAPELKLPDGESVASLVDAVGHHGIKKI